MKAKWQGIPKKLGDHTPQIENLYTRRPYCKEEEARLSQTKIRAC